MPAKTEHHARSYDLIVTCKRALAVIILTFTIVFAVPPAYASIMLQPHPEAFIVTTVIHTKTNNNGKHAGSGRFKVVPETRELRDRIRTKAACLGSTFNRSRPLTREELEEMSRKLLTEVGLGEQYLGFTMVAISNEFWREQVQAIDFKRRFLLLPHCLKHAQKCPGHYDKFGLDCENCHACIVGNFKIKAEELGYKVPCLRRHARRTEDHRQWPGGRYRRRGLSQRARESI